MNYYWAFWSLVMIEAGAASWYFTTPRGWRPRRRQR